MIYGAVNEPLLARVPRTTSRLLDTGCGGWNAGPEIKEERNSQVVGIAYSEADAAEITKYGEN